MKERRIMKKKNTDKLTSFLFNILFAMILVVTAIGCSDQAPLEVESESGSSAEATYISVSFGVDTPAFGLPMVTRSTSAGWVENERTYETYTAWVFEQDASSGEYTYRYCVRDDEQIDGEDAISLRSIDGVDNQWTILALLQETSKDTKVVLTANLRESMKGHFPEVGDTYTTLKDARNATLASNEVSDGTTVNAFVIDQEDIMDVTTDDSVFLGLTSGSLNIYRDDCNDDYYFTHFSVISNNGWNTISSELNALPGISLSVTSATKSDCTYSDGRYKTFSVWFYLEKDQYTPANYPTNQFEIKVYTGNIQKKIKVNYIDSDRP